MKEKKKKETKQITMDTFLKIIRPLQEVSATSLRGHFRRRHIITDGDISTFVIVLKEHLVGQDVEVEDDKLIILTHCKPSLSFFNSKFKK